MHVRRLYTNRSGAVGRTYALHLGVVGQVRKHELRLPTLAVGALSNLQKGEDGCLAMKQDEGGERGEGWRSAPVFFVVAYFATRELDECVYTHRPDPRQQRICRSLLLYLEKKRNESMCPLPRLKAVSLLSCSNNDGGMSPRVRSRRLPEDKQGDRSGAGTLPIPTTHMQVRFFHGRCNTHFRCKGSTRTCPGLSREVWFAWSRKLAAPCSTSALPPPPAAMTPYVVAFDVLSSSQVWKSTLRTFGKKATRLLAKT